MLAGLAWLIVTGLLARTELHRVEQGLTTLHQDLSDQDFDQARADAVKLQTNTHRAHSLTSGPAWWFAAKIPWIGQPAKVARVSADVADELSRTALPSVTEAADKLNPHTLWSGESIKLAPIRDIAPTLQAASTATQRAVAQVAKLPTSTWLPPVNSARATLADQLRSISATLTSANRAAQLAPEMLGANGTRRYFIAIQNEAEARGLGGLPGSFIIVTATDGKIAFTYFGSDMDLDATSADVSLSEDYLAKWKQADPTAVYVNSDIGVNPPDAAKIWASMWRQKSGENVDGVISVDPTAISYLLAAAGPATLPNGTIVSSDDIVSLTQKDIYARYGATTQARVERKDELTLIAKAVKDQLLASTDSAGMIKGALKAASERRLIMWSSHPDEQRELLQTSLARDWSKTKAPVSGFTVVNAAGSKLDYYLDRSMTYSRFGCGDKRLVTASLKLTNDAPTSGLPPYVTIRADNPTYPTKPGDNRLIVSYYGTPGGVVRAVLVDGKKAPVSVTTEDGLVSIAVDLELPAGQSRTVAVQLVEPAATGKVQFIDQPLVRSEQQHISGADEKTCPF